MKNIVIGRYIPGNSFLYSMDPRAKIITLLILMIGVFLLDSIVFMLVSIGLIALLLLAGRISIKRVYLGLRPLMFLLIFTFTFQILFNDQGDELYAAPTHFSLLTVGLLFALIVLWLKTKQYIRFKLLYFLLFVVMGFAVLINIDTGLVFATPTFSVHQEGVNMALFIMLRLIIIVTLSTILTITTKPTDLNLGLERVLKPLSLVKINAEEIAMIISIALRYIPTLLDEANKIMLAQASRGVDFNEGKMKDKVMQVVSLLVPMFIISFKRSDELANAMEARSFAPGQPRTKLHELFWHRLDTLALIMALGYFTFAVLTRVLT